ncbi:DNA-directed DNA polymerase II small subunit [Nanoarchaeota archaeon]
MESIERKKEVVRHFLDRGILVSSDFLESFNSEEKLDQISGLPEDLLILQKETLSLIGEKLNWSEYERVKVLEEKGKAKVEYTKIEEKKAPPFKIVTSHEMEPEKREVSNFVDYFSVRYKNFERLLKSRHEIVNLMSVSRAKNKKEKETLSIIGLVASKDFTKAGNLIITLEDQTGSIKVLLSKNKPELFNHARDLVLDEVVGIVGVCGENIVFANEVVWPDIPLTKELKKSAKEEYALFLSDVHVGSNLFLEKDFQKFTNWLSGNAGNEKQKEIASKVKYIFIVGDLVDGCGIYPSQEKDLVIKNITDQYKRAAELLKQIPKEMNIIICPGNHDAVRLSEPQPRLYEDFAADLYSMPNVTLVSNPSLINISSDGKTPGLDVLMYHGFSFDYYIANVDTIRNNGGYDRADLVMKFLLQRRHLAPSHTSTLYIPDTQKDPLIIDQIPDIFVTGHIHKSIVAQFRNITLISGSCWQSKTDYQEKLGHNPEPSRVPIVNLHTREAKILRFGE